MGAQCCLLTGCRQRALPAKRKCSHRKANKTFFVLLGRSWVDAFSLAVYEWCRRREQRHKRHKREKEHSHKRSHKEHRERRDKGRSSRHEVQDERSDQQPQQQQPEGKLEPATGIKGEPAEGVDVGPVDQLQQADVGQELSAAVKAEHATDGAAGADLEALREAALKESQRSAAAKQAEATAEPHGSAQPTDMDAEVPGAQLVDMDAEMADAH